MFLKRSKYGFTLVEIMIVVAIIALLAGIAIPNLLRAQQNARVTDFVASIRQMENALTMYSVQNGGSYPSDVLQEIEPAGMSTYLAGNPWIERTPLGGYWDWDNHLTSLGWLRISIIDTSNEIDTALMLRVDETLDDGVLSSGDFQQEGANYRYFMHRL